MFWWKIGAPYRTYPFPLHDPCSPVAPGYFLLSVSHDPSQIRVRATRCLGSLVSQEISCQQCLESRVFFDVVHDHASRHPGKFELETLSYWQCAQRISTLKDAVQTERLNVCFLITIPSEMIVLTTFISQYLNASKLLEQLRHHQDTWSNLLQLVGTNDVPALYRIFRNAHENNWSAEKLFQMLQLACEGKYHAKNYSDFDYSLAIAIYELGGGAALYALQKSPYAFPSRTSVLARRQDFKVIVSCGAPLMTDIHSNIKTTCSTIPPNHRRCGVTLMMDEINGNGRLSYQGETDGVVGLCEHAEKFGSTWLGETPEVALSIALAVQRGEIHVGQEVFVAAIARQDDFDYSARPILLLPTCKQSSFQDQALIVEMLRQAWKTSPYGEALHGPIWSIASDGDPKRRPALYLHCMVRELQPPDALFAHLGHLQGLNLWCGVNGETQDLDYKHNFKREFK